jgi:hypothetical protein
VYLVLFRFCLANGLSSTLGGRLCGRVDDEWLRKAKCPGLEFIGAPCWSPSWYDVGSSMAAVYGQCWRRWDCAKVNRGPSRVSRRCHPLPAGSSGLPQSRGPCTGTDNSIPNPQNAHRRLALPSCRSIHFLMMRTHLRADVYMPACETTGAGGACSLFQSSPMSVYLHESISKSRAIDDKVRHVFLEG